MEFSEINELRRVLKMSTYNKDSGFKHSLPERMIDYDIDMQEELRHSPPCSIPNELGTSLPDDFLENQIEIKITKEEVPETELQVTKYDNFKENYYESITKVSTLTQSIMNESIPQRDRRRSSDKMNTLLDLKIYLFGTLDTLDVSVPFTTTIEQLISRIIALYIKSDNQKIKPLPKGPVVEAYQI